MSRNTFLILNIVLVLICYACLGDDELNVPSTLPEYFLIDTTEVNNLIIINPRVDFFSSSQEFSLLGSDVEHLQLQGGYHAQWLGSTIEKYSMITLTGNCSLRAHNSMDTIITYYNGVGCRVTRNYSYNDNIPDSSIVDMEIRESIQVPRLQIGDTIYTSNDRFVYSEEYQLYDYYLAYYDGEENCFSTAIVQGDWSGGTGYIPFRLENEEALFIGWIELYTYGGIVKSDRIGYYKYDK